MKICSHNSGPELHNNQFATKQTYQASGFTGNFAESSQFKAPLSTSNMHIPPSAIDEDEDVIIEEFDDY